MRLTGGVDFGPIFSRSLLIHSSESSGVDGVAWVFSSNFAFPIFTVNYLRLLLVSFSTSNAMLKLDDQSPVERCCSCSDVIWEVSQSQFQLFLIAAWRLCAWRLMSAKKFAHIEFFRESLRLRNFSSASRSSRRFRLRISKDARTLSPFLLKLRCIRFS